MTDVFFFTRAAAFISRRLPERRSPLAAKAAVLSAIRVNHRAGAGSGRWRMAERLATSFA